MTNSAETVCQNLSLVMRVRGLDKSKLGRKLGMSHTNVHNKLSGERPMRVEELADFAAALDVPPSVLYGSTADVLRWLADESERSDATTG